MDEEFEEVFSDYIESVDTQFSFNGQSKSCGYDSDSSDDFNDDFDYFSIGTEDIGSFDDF